MKKSIRIIGMAAMVMLLTVSCKKEKQNETQTFSIKAGIESPAGKTYLDSDYHAYWKNTDKITVQGNTLSIKEMGYQNMSATFEGSWDLSLSPLPDGQNYINAVTPATQQKKISTGGWASLVSVPKVQPYIKNSFMDDLPMGCRSNTYNNLQFHNLTTVFRIQVYAASSQKVYSVVMEKNLDDPILPPQPNRYFDNNPLAATVWYPHAGDDLQDAEIVESENTSYTITVDCGDGVDISTQESMPTVFHFVTWPVQMDHGIIFHFKDKDGNDIAVIRKDIKSVDKVEQNRVYTVCENNTGDEAGKPYELTWLN